MATMKDIARQAGVSTSTVSHVINQSRFVSEEISAKVLKAASELNYSPSALARSLKLNRTSTIGLVVTASNNPFFGEVVKGVERRCYQRGFNLILCNTEGDVVRMNKSVSTLVERRVDGLILLCSAFNGDPLAAFNNNIDLPKVVMDWGEVSYPCDKINDNSELGGYMATSRLIEAGHRDIACITGPLDRNQASSRFSGYQKAMHEAGLPIRSEWVVESDFECEGGYQSFNRIVELCHNQKMPLPSAVFACNDMMAMGVINAANEHELSVPASLSVIGYDDVEIAKFMVPALTTIHQPKYRLGEAAVDTLLQRIANLSDQPRQIQLEPTLVERKSIKSLNSAC